MKEKGEDGFVTHYKGKNFYAGLTTRKSFGFIRIGDSKKYRAFREARALTVIGEIHKIQPIPP